MALADPSPAPLIVALLSMVMLAIPEPMRAQPINDACADAIPLEDGFHSFTNIDATLDGPSVCTLITQDIWFLYTAPCRGEVTVSTCGQVNYDSVLAVFPADAGCPPGLETAVACNDDGPCPEFSSLLTFPTLENRTYLIQVSGWHAESGSGTLTLECEARSAPLITRGDANRDGLYSLPDVLETIEVLSLNRPSDCLAALDANADEALDLGDILFTLAAIFQGGPLPSAPYPDCGFAPTTLTCAEDLACP